MPEILDPRRVSVAAVFAAVAGAWQAFRCCVRPAAGFAAIFVVIGVAIFALLIHFGLAPMMLPFAGGFLLVGPAVDVKLFAMQAGAFGRPFAVRFAPVTLVVAAVCATAVGLLMLGGTQ